MKALSVSEAKMKLSGLIETVNATDEEIVITKNGRPVPTSDGGCRPTGALFRNLGLYPWGSTIGKLLGEKYHLSQNRMAPTYNRAFSAGRRLLYQSVIGSLSD